MRIVTALLVLALACNETTELRKAAPSATSVASAKAGAPTPPATPAAGDVTWLRVASGYRPVATIEFRGAAPGKLDLVSSGDEATKLKKLWPSLSKPGGVIAEMHLPPKDGKGRGSLGARVLKPGDKGYISYIEVELEDEDFNSAKVLELEVPSPTKPIQALTYHRSGKKLGTLTFGPKPALALESPKSADVMFLESDWDYIQKQPSLEVWHVGKDPSGAPKLVHLKAKPGDPAYGDVVRIWLFSVRQYDKQRAYRVDIETAP